MSGQSELSSVFRGLLKSPQTTTGNTSWFLGSTHQNKAPSYVTVLKAPKTGTSAISAGVAAHFGVDTKNPKKVKHHESLLGSILGGAADVGGHLVSDVITTAENTPAGLLKIATTNPLDTAKLIAQDYSTRYGKLFHGDFGGFAHDVASHPLGYLLDASTLGTGGGAILGHIAPALAKGGEVALRLDRTASEVSNVTRPLSSNVFTRNVLEKPAYALQRTLPGKLPVLGEASAAKRTLANSVESKTAEGFAKVPEFERAVKAAQKQTDTIQNAMDLVTHDLRVAGHASKYTSTTNFDLKAGMKSSPESKAVADQIKGEIQIGADKQIVAKADATPATVAFVRLHNAKESLNQIWEQNNKIKVGKSGKGYLDGLKPVDVQTDPIRNYLDTHVAASSKVAKLTAEQFVKKYTEDPQVVRELTQMYETRGPAGSLSNSLNKSTQLWKDVILLGRPAFLVNNYVGNQIMYHLKNGAAGKSLQMAAKGDLNKPFDTFFHEHRQSLGLAEDLKTESRYGRIRSKGYGLQSAHEQVLRKGTMREAAMSIPAIKTEVRVLTGKGVSEGKALEQALNKTLKSPDGNMYRQTISKAIDDTMGNYRHFNSSEQLLRKAVPFYSWNRHALRTYSSILKDQPGTANVLANVAVEGKAENSKMFPGVPDFMHTYVTGKLGTYDTQALNPLKGGSDTIKSLKELINAKSGQMPAIASNLNPLIVGAGQALAGTNFTTGAPVNTTGGLAGSVLEQTIGGLPQVKLAQLKFGGTPGNRNDPHYFLTPTGQLKHKFLDSMGKVKLGPDGLPLEAADRHMINPSVPNSVLSWLGIPKRDINLKTAQTVKKSIDSKVNPVTDFHARKKRKAAIKRITNIH